MASPEAVQLLESVYSRVDKQVRDILAAIPDLSVDDYEILLQFDGGGAALTAGLSGTLEVPVPGRIVGARMFVGRLDAASSATVTVRFGTYGDYPASMLLSGTGTIPTLTSAVKSAPSIAGWHQYLAARDVLAWDLTTFSGTAQHLTLALLVKKLPANVLIFGMTTAAADRLVTAAGDRVTARPYG